MRYWRSLTGLDDIFALFILINDMHTFFKKTLKFILILVLLGSFYSAFLLSFVWWHCYTSGLQHGKNGPLDAYRHTLASAVLAYSISPKVVYLASTIMENKNQPANLMDKHNNKIGAQIGAHSSSLKAINIAVTAKIAHGCVNAKSTTQTTWLPQQYWRERLFW